MTDVASNRTSMGLVKDGRECLLSLRVRRMNAMYKLPCRTSRLEKVEAIFSTSQFSPKDFCQAPRP